MKRGPASSAARASSGGTTVPAPIVAPPARVNALVQAQLARTVERPTRFESVALWLWPPVRVTVNAPALAEPGGFGAGAAFRASAVHLDLDGWALLRHAVVVRRLQLDD